MADDDTNIVSAFLKQHPKVYAVVAIMAAVGATLTWASDVAETLHKGMTAIEAFVHPEKKPVVAPPPTTDAYTDEDQARDISIITSFFSAHGSDPVDGRLSSADIQNGEISLLDMPDPTMEQSVFAYSKRGSAGKAKLSDLKSIPIGSTNGPLGLMTFGCEKAGCFTVSTTEDIGAEPSVSQQSGFLITTYMASPEEKLSLMRAFERLVSKSHTDTGVCALAAQNRLPCKSKL